VHTPSEAYPPVGGAGESQGDALATDSPTLTVEIFLPAAPPSWIEAGRHAIRQAAPVEAREHWP